MIKRAGVEVMNEHTNVKICSIESCNEITYCKCLCRVHYNKQWHASHKEYTSQYNKDYKKKNIEKNKVYNKTYATSDIGRFNKAKSKAKVRGLDFDLYYEDFIDISSRPCFYCADELCGKKDFQGAHLDRIDNSLGYTLDNVISCGLLCNQIRMANLTVAETKDAVQGILSGRKIRQNQNVWCVYILRCADDSLYTGITNNLEKRIKQHNESKGAKYTMGRGPVALVKCFEVLSKGEALKLEYHIKQLPREEKLNYVQEKQKE
jgi:putative endonuclease